MSSCFVSLHVGECGNSLGIKLWEQIAEEYEIDKTGKYCGKLEDENERIPLFFDESPHRVRFPRAISVDLDPGLKDRICTSGSIGRIFPCENICVGPSGAGNNFAKGHYTEGAELFDEELEDIVRNEVEKCDSFHGFIMTRALGGGTGSGLGSLILLKLRECYPSKCFLDLPLTPSPKCDVVVEPYNMTLCMLHLHDNCDFAIFNDLEALYNVAFRQLRLTCPKYSDLHNISIASLNGATSSLRLPGELSLNSDISKNVFFFYISSYFERAGRMAMNMVPFPNLKYLIPGFQPMTPQLSNRAFPDEKNRHPILSYTGDVVFTFSRSGMLCDANPLEGRFLAPSFTTFRYGRGLTYNNCYQTVQNALNSSSGITIKDCFYEWTPKNVEMSFYNVQQSSFTCPTVTTLHNSTSIRAMFQRISEQFHAMFRRKAFLQWYLGEGMDEMEFTEAGSILNDLISEYQQYEEIREDDDLDDGEAVKELNE